MFILSDKTADDISDIFAVITTHHIADVFETADDFFNFICRSIDFSFCCSFFGFCCSFCFVTVAVYVVIIFFELFFCLFVLC